MSPSGLGVVPVGCGEGYGGDDPLSLVVPVPCEDLISVISGYKGLNPMQIMYVQRFNRNMISGRTFFMLKEYAIDM